MAKVVWSVIGVIVVVFFLYIVINHVAFKNRIGEQIATYDTLVKKRNLTFRYESLSQLPEPVQRYFRYALADGSPYIYSAQLKQSGKFRLKADLNLAADEDWKPLTAREYISLDPPAYFRTVSIKLAPFIYLQGWDRYLKGEGQIFWRVLSAIPIVNSTGNNVDQASLLRCLTEAVWLPTALLPDEYRNWEAIDSVSARATIHDHGKSASAIFYFDSVGRITHLETRGNTLNAGNNEYSPARSTVYFSDYREVNGVNIPARTEAVWNSAGGNFSYAKYRISEIRFNQPFK